MHNTSRLAPATPSARSACVCVHWLNNVLLYSGCGPSAEAAPGCSACCACKKCRAYGITCWHLLSTQNFPQHSGGQGVACTCTASQQPLILPCTRVQDCFWQDMICHCAQSISFCLIQCSSCCLALYVRHCCCLLGNNAGCAGIVWSGVQQSDSLHPVIKCTVLSCCTLVLSMPCMYDYCCRVCQCNVVFTLCFCSIILKCKLQQLVVHIMCQTQ